MAILPENIDSFIDIKCYINIVRALEVYQSYVYSFDLYFLWDVKEIIKFKIIVKEIIFKKIDYFHENFNTSTT